MSQSYVAQLASVGHHADVFVDNVNKLIPNLRGETGDKKGGPVRRKTPAAPTHKPLCSANIHAAFGSKPVWCKFSNGLYDIVIWKPMSTVGSGAGEIRIKDEAGYVRARIMNSERANVGKISANLRSTRAPFM